MTDQPEDRGVLIDRLRRMADWLEHHPDLPLSPYASVMITAYTDDPLVAVRVMDEHPGNWTASESDSLIVHELGREVPWAVTYQVVLLKPPHQVPASQGCACDTEGEPARA